MNFFKYFKRPKKKSNYGIIPLSSLIDIGSIERSIKDYSLVQPYEEEYLKRLEDKRTFLSNDLEYEEIKKEVEMYSKMITNACYSEDLDTSSLVNLKKEKLLEKKLEMEILNIKLNIYLEEIKRLVLKTDCLIVALNEVYKKLLDEEKRKRYKIFRLYLTREDHFLDTKISSVEDAINNFLSTKLVIENILKAARLTVDATLINIKNILDYINLKKLKIDRETEQKVILSKRKKVRKSVEALPDLEEITIKNKKKYIIANEVMLEKYIFTHESLIDEIRAMVLEKLSWEKYDNRSEELNWIKKIKETYKVFSKYGRDLVNDDDFTMLYQLNFEVCTSDLEHILPIFSCHGLEEKVYENIILDLIDNILNDRLNKLEIFGSKRGQAISLIKDILKNGTDRFIPQKIACNEGLPLLLYYFRKDFNGFMEEYLERKDVRISSSLLFSFTSLMSYLDLENLFLENQSSINHKTIFKLMEWSLNSKFFRRNLFDLQGKQSLICNLFLLNNLYESVKPYYQTSYKLPEGMVTFNLNHINKEFIKKIREDTEDKILVLPSTMKKIYGNGYLHELKGLILNDGLEEITISFNHCNITEMIIPASVKKMNCETFNWNKLKSLEFKSYESSKILFSRAWLNEVLYTFVAENKEPYKPTVKSLAELTDLHELKFLLENGREVCLSREDLMKVRLFYSPDIVEREITFTFCSLSRYGDDYYIDNVQYDKFYNYFNQVIEEKIKEKKLQKLN